jgi:hypothetical protein
MKLAVLGTRGSVPSASKLSNQEVMNSCGQNTGNLLFQAAVNELFKYDNELYYLDEMGDEESVKYIKTCDYLLMPCADFITFEYDLSGLWERIRWYDVPVIAIGLGVGASFDINRLSEIKPGTLNVINHIKKFGAAIFVRGETTCDALIKMGFDMGRVHVTGCPSNFLSKTSYLIDSFDNRKKTISGDVRNLGFLLFGDRYWIESNFDVERHLYRLFRICSKSEWILQSHEPLIDLVRPGGSDKSFYTLAAYLDYLRICINPNGSMLDLINDIRDRYKLFFDIEQWRNHSLKFDFSLGRRLHGNMVAFQSGVPSLWLVHDARTNELAKLMKLPTISFGDLVDINNTMSAARLHELFYENLDTYFSRRQELFLDFSLTLRKLGVCIRGI